MFSSRQSPSGYSGGNTMLSPIGGTVRSGLPYPTSPLTPMSPQSVGVAGYRMIPPMGSTTSPFSSTKLQPAGTLDSRSPSMFQPKRLSPKYDELPEPMSTSPINSQSATSSPMYLPSFLSGLDNHGHQSSMLSPGMKIHSRHHPYSPSSSMHRSPKSSELNQSPKSNLLGNEIGTLLNDKTDEDSTKKKKKGPPIFGFGTDSQSYKDKLDAKGDSNIVTVTLDDDNEDLNLNLGSVTGVWVTIFGFPSAATSYVLSHFSKFGTIVETKSSPGSNWIHVKYANKIESRRAVSHNGDILTRSIMVGALYSTLNDDNEPQTYRCRSSSSRLSPAPHSASSPTSSSAPGESAEPEANEPASNLSSILKSRMKPLVPANVRVSTSSDSKCFRSNSMSLTGDSENLPYSLPVPKASGGSVISKAMEYVFGW